MDTKKYIIEIPDNTAWIQWVKVSDKDGHVYFDFKDPEDLTLYTEPDLDAVRNEAYQQGYKDGYNKHDTEKIRKRGYDKGLDDIGNALRLLLFQYSNYTLQEIFGYDTARAVVEHFEGSEIVARIRCHEGSVKQDAETIRKEAYAEGYKKCLSELRSTEEDAGGKGMSETSKIRMNKIYRFIQICLQLADIADQKKETPFHDELAMGNMAFSGYMRQGVKEIIDLKQDYFFTMSRMELAKNSEKSARDFLKECFGDSEIDSINDADKERILAVCKQIEAEWEE